MEERREISEYETMQERGTFSAAGLVFTIEPVYFDEEHEYFSDDHLSLHLQNLEEKPTDEDVAKLIIALFQIRDEEETKKALGWIERVKLWLAKPLKKDYRFYSDCPGAVGLAKWIEKKVRLNGKRIRFYDLERKYGLTKKEIAEMYCYLQEISFF